MKRFSTICFLIWMISCVPFRSEAQVVYEFANSQVTSTASCVSCSVKDSLLAVDGDLTTFSELEMQAGLPGSFVSQMLIFPTNACAGDTIYLVVENPLLALDSILNGIAISTSYKGNPNPDEQQVISAGILPGNLTLIKYTPAFAYDRLLVKMYGGIALGVSNLRIYYAYRYSELAQIEGNMVICQKQGTVLSLNPVRPSTVYAWYDEPTDGNLLFTGNNSFFTGPLDSTTTFYVQRCANAVRQAFTVTVIDKPDVPVVLGQKTICKGDQVNLQATSVFPGANFTWYDEAGNEVITNNFYSAILGESTRFIVYTVLNGCYSDPDTVDINVVEHLAAPQVQCGTPTINSILFEWDPIPGAIQYEVSLDLGSSYSVPTGAYSHLVAPLNFGDTRTLFVRAIGSSPCWDTIVSAGVTCVATNCSAVTFNAPDKIELCREDTGLISLSSISSASYEVSWDNGPFAMETLYKKTIQANDTVRVEVRDPAQPGCPTTVKYIPIDLLPAPEAAFTSDKQLVTVPNGLVQFFDNTIGAQSWKWDFGDGQTSADRNPVHLYQTPGKYTVTLEVTNVFGCKDTVIQADFMEGKYAPQLFVPNTFTPNEDQLNDHFIAKGERIQQYHVQVFNASGKLLYEGRALNDGWDGTYMGEKQPAAPYFYKVDALADDNVEFHLKGIINLVR